MSLHERIWARCRGSVERAVKRAMDRVHTGVRERDLEDADRSSFQALYEHHLRQGLAPAAAIDAARRDCGGLERMKDTYRDQRRLAWVHDLRDDVRYAVRALARNRAFTTMSVLTLALGIGATSAAFSVVNAVLLRPLPYPDGDRLVKVIMTLLPPNQPYGEGTPLRIPVGVSAAELGDFKTRSRTLSDVGVAGGQLMALRGYEDAARLQAARISASALRMLGARPLIGRLFTESDEAAAAEPTILVSFSAWWRFFAGDPAIIGRSLTFDSVLGPPRQTTYTVVGVLPDSFALPYPETLFWTSFQPPAPDRIGGPRVAMIGRLRNDVSLEAASSEVIPFVRDIRRGQPQSGETRYELVREKDELVAPIRPALLLLAVAAGFLLLISCVNVANLMLARASGRVRETAIRAALGAGRGRVIRLLLTESVTVALTGGLVGLAVAFGGVRLVRAFAATAPRFDLAVVGTASPQFPRIAEIGIDGAVLGFTCAVAIVAGVFFGLVVAIRQSRVASDDLRVNVSTGASGFGRMGTKSLLVVGEIAAAMVLLVGGGLLVRSFSNLSAVDAGYNPSNVLSFQVSLPANRYSDDRLRTFAEDTVGRLRSIPGVQRAAYARQLPLVGLVDNFQFGTSPSAATGRSETMGADLRLVSRDYLRVMGIDLMSGRYFENGDTQAGPRVLLANESLARRYFPGSEAVGQTVYLGAYPDIPWQIVGIVRNVRQFTLDREPTPQLFMDVRQWPGSGLPLFPAGTYYAVRVSGDPMAVAAPIRDLVRQADAEARVFSVAPMEALVASTISRPRMYAMLTGALAVVGAALSVIGIYGLMAYSVAQRTTEIGVRIALGANRRGVLSLVLHHSMSLTAIGCVLGLAGAAALTRYLEGMLFGITTSDPATFATATALFALASLAGTLVPAMRAIRVDPLTALRYE